MSQITLLGGPHMAHNHHLVTPGLHGHPRSAGGCVLGISTGFPVEQPFAFNACTISSASGVAYFCIKA